MKKLLVMIILICNVFVNGVFALDHFSVDSSSTIQANVNEVVNADGIGADPLRAGTTNIGTRLNNTVNTPIGSNSQAEAATVNLVKNFVNYALGFLGLVALIYLAYNGFGILTAGGDDSKAQKGYKGINYSLYALLGIGFTWFMISFAIYLVNRFFIGS